MAGGQVCAASPGRLFASGFGIESNSDVAATACLRGAVVVVRSWLC